MARRAASAVPHDIGVPARPSPLFRVATREVRPVSEPVTLCVYGWHNVQPGTLAWVFASLEAALEAVRAMRNAVEWVIVRGSLTRDRARHGEILAAST